MKAYQKISSLIMAIESCDKNTDNQNSIEWSAKHRETLAAIEKDLPSGSGIDCGTTIDPDSTADEIILHFSFHHMDDIGCYDGWSELTARVTPSLAFGIEILFEWEESRHPSDEDVLEDYFGDVYQIALNEEIA